MDGFEHRAAQFHTSSEEPGTVVSDHPSYDIQQVCLNGHWITDAYIGKSSLRKNFCTKCGEPTIIRCPKCEKTIKGYNNLYRYSDEKPKFCEYCGEAMPWTSRGLDEIKEYVEEAVGLTSDERTKLLEAFTNILRDTPKTPRAAEKVRKYVDSLKEPAQQVILTILKTLVVDGAKHIVFRQ